LHKGEKVMTQPKWNDKDQNGEYIHFDMRHEVYEHGETEEDAVAILTKYFGPEPTIDSDLEDKWWQAIK
jgi:hypothetical protein